MHVCNNNRLLHFAWYLPGKAQNGSVFLGKAMPVDIQHLQHGTFDQQDNNVRYIAGNQIGAGKIDIRDTRDVRRGSRRQKGNPNEPSGLYDTSKSARRCMTCAMAGATAAVSVVFRKRNSRI